MNQKAIWSDTAFRNFFFFYDFQMLLISKLVLNVSYIFVVLWTMFVARLWK